MYLVTRMLYMVYPLTPPVPLCLPVPVMMEGYLYTTPETLSLVTLSQIHVYTVDLIIFALAI